MAANERLKDIKGKCDCLAKKETERRAMPRRLLLHINWFLRCLFPLSTCQVSLLQPTSNLQEAWGASRDSLCILVQKLFAVQSAKGVTWAEIYILRSDHPYSVLFLEFVLDHKMAFAEIVVIVHLFKSAQMCAPVIIACPSLHWSNQTHWDYFKRRLLCVVFWKGRKRNCSGVRTELLRRKLRRCTMKKERTGSCRIGFDTNPSVLCFRKLTLCPFWEMPGLLQICLCCMRLFAAEPLWGFSCRVWVFNCVEFNVCWCSWLDVVFCLITGVLVDAACQSQFDLSTSPTNPSEIWPVVHVSQLLFTLSGWKAKRSVLNLQIFSPEIVLFLQGPFRSRIRTTFPFLFCRIRQSGGGRCRIAETDRSKRYSCTSELQRSSAEIPSLSKPDRKSGRCLQTKAGKPKSCFQRHWLAFVTEISQEWRISTLESSRSSQQALPSAWRKIQAKRFSVRSVKNKSFFAFDTFWAQFLTSKHFCNRNVFPNSMSPNVFTFTLSPLCEVLRLHSPAVANYWCGVLPLNWWLKMFVSDSTCQIHTAIASRNQKGAETSAQHQPSLYVHSQANYHLWRLTWQDRWSVHHLVQSKLLDFLFWRKEKLSWQPTLGKSVGSCLKFGREGLWGHGCFWLIDARVFCEFLVRVLISVKNYGCQGFSLFAIFQNEVPE